MLLFGWLKKKKKTSSAKPEEKSVEKKATATAVVEHTEPLEEQPDQQVEEQQKKERKIPYHVTKHPKGGWQVKKGKADRALKRFDTQKEAIDYAKQMEKERGVSFIIHKADGSIRKKEY